jgi:hypothetical protein
MNLHESPVPKLYKLNELYKLYELHPPGWERDIFSLLESRIPVKFCLEVECYPDKSNLSSPSTGEEQGWYKPDTLVTHLLNTWVTGSFLGKEVLPCPGKRPVL